MSNNENFILSLKLIEKINQTRLNLGDETFIDFIKEIYVEKKIELPENITLFSLLFCILDNLDPSEFLLKLQNTAKKKEINQVLKEVSNYFNIPISNIVNTKNNKEIKTIKIIAVALMNRVCFISLKNISLVFNLSAGGLCDSYMGVFNNLSDTNPDHIKILTDYNNIKKILKSN